MRDVQQMTDSTLDSWVECLLIGITRCGVGSRSIGLNEYYRRHRDDIEAHPERDRIIEAFRDRKDEIRNVRKK